MVSARRAPRQPIPCVFIRMKAHRIITSLLLSAALGLFTTTLLAWGCSLWTSCEFGESSAVHARPGERIPLDKLGELGAIADPDWLPHEPSAGTTSAIFESCRGIGVFDSGLTIMGSFGGCATGNEIVTLHRAGWPRPALQCACVLRGQTWRWEGSIPNPPWITRTSRASYCDRLRPPLPLRPIALGLTADTLLFTLAWSLLLFAPRAIRRRLRLRRGHCPNCNYNLAGLPPNSPCPECGRLPNRTAIVRERTPSCDAKPT